MKFTKLLTALVIACMAPTMGACGDDEPATGGGTQVTPNDPAGTIAVNLTKGKFEKENAILFRTAKAGWTGEVYLYADNNSNLVVRPETEGEEGYICFVGVVKSLSEITAIPTTPAWSLSTAVETTRGYVVCYKITNSTTGEIAWEYGRVYVAGLAGSATTITGWAIKYQPNWKTTDDRVM